MLKRILLLIAVCLVLFSPMVVFAEGNSETTTQIDEEKTPEAARKKDYTLYYAGAGILLVVAAAALVTRKKHDSFRLILDNVEDNEDGSYTVYLGYDNPTNEVIRFNEGEAGLRVLKGNAILLKKDNLNEFNKGNQKDVVVAVINKDSELEYYAGEEHIVIKGSELIRKEGEK